MKRGSWFLKQQMSWPKVQHLPTAISLQEVVARKRQSLNNKANSGASHGSLDDWFHTCCERSLEPFTFIPRWNPNVICSWRRIWESTLRQKHRWQLFFSQRWHWHSHWDKSAFGTKAWAFSRSFSSTLSFFQFFSTSNWSTTAWQDRPLQCYACLKSLKHLRNARLNVPRQGFSFSCDVTWRIIRPHSWFVKIMGILQFWGPHLRLKLVSNPGKWW